MPTDSRDRVSATFLDVVEKLTFMFGEAVPVDDLPETEGLHAEAWLTFSGDVCGRLAIIVPENLTPQIAGNILGLEPEDVLPGEMKNDALCELLNVVAGHVVMALAGSKSNFTLSAPTFEVLDREAFAAVCADPDTATYLLDDNPVLLNLNRQ